MTELESAEMEWTDREIVAFALENHRDPAVAVGCIVWRGLFAQLVSIGYWPVGLKFDNGYLLQTLVPVGFDLTTL